MQLEMEINYLISLQQEGTYWDFKQEWYDDQHKFRLLHDIINLANNLEFRDAYLILGVAEDQESKGFSVVGVENDEHRKNTQCLVDFLRGKHFGGGVTPVVKVETLTIQRHEVDVIIIKADRNVPYYLSNKYEKVEVGNIYIRQQDGNTPINETANDDKVARLWKRRFGLEASISDRFKLYLADKGNWIKLNDHYHYYKPFPEFTIKIVEDEEVCSGRNCHEFYSFAQYDSSVVYKKICLYYHQTLIFEKQGVFLDGGRMFTSTPEEDFITDGSEMFEHQTYLFRYRILGTLNALLDSYFIEDPHLSSEESIARRKLNKFIILFHSEEELYHFKRFAQCYIRKFDFTSIEDQLPFIPESTEYVAKAYLEQARHTLALKRLALDFFDKEGIEDLQDQ